MSDRVRAHVVLPRDLVEGVDAIVGQRQRSQFVAEAVEDKLRRIRFRALMREAAGSLDLEAHPEWSTPEKVSAWVRELRRPNTTPIEEFPREGEPQ